MQWSRGHLSRSRAAPFDSAEDCRSGIGASSSSRSWQCINGVHRLHMCTLQDKVLPLASACQHVLFKKRRKSGAGETMVRRQSGRKSSLAALVLRKLLLQDFKRPQIDGVSWRVPENGGPQRLKWPSEAVVCEGRSYCARHCREGRCNARQGNISAFSALALNKQKPSTNHISHT